MKLVITVLLASAAVAQTLPTLPAVNTVTGSAVVCTLESLDDRGGLSSECKLLADATIVSRTVTDVSDAGVLVGHGEILCLYWTESVGKYRLQCGAQDKVVIDGYMPPVTRKRKWYVFWR